MRISSITSIQNNRTSFNRRANVSVPLALQKKQKPQKVKRPMNIEDKMILGVQCLGVIAAAAVTRVILKENNIDLAKSAQKGIENLGKKLSNKPQESEVVRLLNGKRDAEAVRTYNAYMASVKQKSLKDKVLNGEFNGKPKKVFQHLTKNSTELQRMASAL